MRFYCPLRYIGFKAAKRIVLPAVMLCLIPTAVSVIAQDRPTGTAATTVDNPLSSTNRRFYAGMKTMLLGAAERVPQEHYGFKPAETVRTYGQIIGHLADSHYNFCSIVLGEKRPAVQIEQTKSAKTDLIAALKESFSYCDRAYNGMTDAQAAQIVRFNGKDASRLGVFSAYMAHSGLHYGNLATYMRIKNIVPPTSDPGFFDPPKK